jgi:Zn-finger nucleic acid-binding protein
MKTAMRELLDKFEEVKDLHNMVQLMILRGELERLLQKEKEQITEAFYKGDNGYGCMYDAVNYYEETYKK